MDQHLQLVGLGDSETGDCFRACMSYLLGVPNGSHLPTIHTDNDPAWFANWLNFLEPMGLSLPRHIVSVPLGTYAPAYIAAVPSLNVEGAAHAVVIKHGLVLFDPSTAKRYPTSTQVTSTMVNWTISLAVQDATLLHHFVSWRETFSGLASEPPAAKNPVCWACGIFNCRHTH